MDFKSILDNEQEKGDWGFKALKQRRWIHHSCTPLIAKKVTKIHFLKLRQFPQALEYYNQLLTYTKSAVTRNYSEKSINGILDYVSSDKASDQTLDLELMEKFYSVTMKTLAEMKNERLSVKTNLKLAKLWLDRREYSRLDAVSIRLFDLIKLTALRHSKSCVYLVKVLMVQTTSLKAACCLKYSHSRYRCIPKQTIPRS